LYNIELIDLSYQKHSIICIAAVCNYKRNSATGNIIKKISKENLIYCKMCWKFNNVEVFSHCRNMNY